MAATLIAFLFSLAAVGVGEGGASKAPGLRGEVVEPDGRPMPGAVVVASVDGWNGESPAEIGRATADEGGRFILELLDPPTDCDKPILWAIRPGSVAASIPIDREATSGRPLRLNLDHSPGASFVVAGPDGRPIEGARITPWRIARDVAAIPEAVASLASAKTDSDGRATLHAFRPEEILEVRVEAAGFGVQVREFRTPEGMSDVGTKSIVLLPAGLVTGRVVADDPKSVAGLTVRVSSSGSGRGGSIAGLAEVSTDASGHFEVEAIASGSVLVRVIPREGQPELPTRVIRRNLDPGKRLEVEIPLRRGVKVAGTVVDDRDGRPIAGAIVSVIPPGPLEPVRVRTDVLGHYEAFVPSGLVGHRVLKAPAPYLCPPTFVGPRPVEVPPAIARFELPKFALTRGSDVLGRVVDKAGQPVEGARVEASWTMFDGRIRAPRSVCATSRPDGSFVVGPVAPDAEVSLAASSGESSTERTVQVRPIEAQAVELSVVEPDGVALGGRVVDRDGRGVVGASVRIWAFDRSPSGSIAASSQVRFDGSDGLRTDLDGHYLTPKRLRVGRDYLAVASLEGHRAGRTRPLRPGGPGSSTFPDLSLPIEPARFTLEGRLVDRKGRPIDGVTVWTSGDGPCCLRATTDLEGRFRLVGVPERRSILYAEAAGFRFFGKPIDPPKGPLEMTLTALGEEPGGSMSSPPRSAGDIELARKILAPYADRALIGGDHSSRIRTLELLARVDTKRVLALVDSRTIKDAWFADHLRHAVSCALSRQDADGRMAIIGTIRDAECRVLAALDASDSLPGSSRNLKRECIEMALRDARSIGEPARRIVALARVADRLIDLDEPARASRLFEETRPVARSLRSAAPGGQSLVEFAECLSRVDPVTALALTEEILDPGAFDRCRLAIVCKLAAREPSRVAPILESLRDPRSLARALPGVCHALAPVAPTVALQLIARARGDDPCLPAYALGMMALAVSDRDKSSATAWLREAFDRLAKVANSGPPESGASRDPAAVAAALLPVAERIDPKLVPELFWRAASLYVDRPGSEGRSDALLALLLARYDRDVARSFFEPAADRALASDPSDLAAILTASAVLDPDLAVHVVNQLPEAPDLTFHHPRNEATLTLAAALARGAPGRWDDAVSRLLQLWAAPPPGRE